VKAVQTSATGNQRGFTGYYLDQESGLYYARARMNSPVLGRYISRNGFGDLRANKYSAPIATHFPEAIKYGYDRKGRWRKNRIMNAEVNIDATKISLVGFDPAITYLGTGYLFYTLLDYIDGMSLYGRNPRLLDPAGDPEDDPIGGIIKAIAEALEKIHKNTENEASIDACKNAIADYKKDKTLHNCESVCEQCGQALSEANSASANYVQRIALKCQTLPDN
jgi:RHS repeat-associated protein